MARYSSLDPEKYLRIRDAAISLFYEQGMQNTSIREIAKAAEIAKGTIYLYFDSREALVDYVFDYCFDLHIKASIEGLDTLTGCCERLKKRVKNILLWNKAFPKESSILSTYYVPVNVGGTEAVAFSKSYEINKQIIDEGIENGELKKMASSFLYTVFFSAVEGCSTYVRHHPEVFEDESLLDQMLDTVLDVIRIR